MDIKESVSELLEKEVDRREFLMHVGAAIAAIVGISSLLRNLTTPPTLRGKGRSGFGMGSYGK